jgi:hypothetical protein
VLTVGDTISFYPEIKIDPFDAIEDAVPSFRHLLCDIYEFAFRPIEAFPNNLHKDCYHYLIELWPGFEVFHFNWVVSTGRTPTTGETSFSVLSAALTTRPVMSSAYISILIPHGIRTT